MADFRTPNWAKWGNYILATVHQAIALSCNADPDWITGFGGTFARLPSDYSLRVGIARSHIRAGRLGVHVSVSGDEDDDQIDLLELAAWSQTLNPPWSLPPGFPPAVPSNSVPPATEALASKPAPQASSKGGVTIELPHTTHALDALFAVIRKYWTNYDPDNLPKQETVAADIDKAIGGKPDKDGAPSRNARALAALIKPDPLAAIDKRGRKRGTED